MKQERDRDRDRDRERANSIKNTTINIIIIAQLLIL